MITLEKVLTELKGETLNEIIGGTYYCGTRTTKTTKTTKTKKCKKYKKDKKYKYCQPCYPCKY